MFEKRRNIGRSVCPHAQELGNPCSHVRRASTGFGIVKQRQRRIDDIVGDLALHVKIVRNRGQESGPRFRIGHKGGNVEANGVATLSRRVCATD